LHGGLLPVLGRATNLDFYLQRIDMGTTFMVQYRDAYGALHNEAVIAADIEAAWKLALDLIGFECRVQQIWQTK